MRSFLFVSLLLCACAKNMQAQSFSGDAAEKKKKVSMTSGIESNLLQIAKVTVLGTDLTTIPRYTYFFNLGTDFNLEASQSVKPFTGINIKNIGLIIKDNDTSRTKHRVYTIGAPVGIKLYFGKEKKTMLKAGADFSLAFNYKWKTITKNGSKRVKEKSNEFFSKDAALFFPSAFVGLSIKGIAISANYYLNNFFGEDVKDIVDTKLFTIGAGIDINKNMFSKKKKASTDTN